MLFSLFESFYVSSQGAVSALIHTGGVLNSFTCSSVVLAVLGASYNKANFLFSF
ncbi:hypothetical protein NSE_0952 [Neorickettsia sennetsu str. Miyayama]|uniref:Uncharacterized protein n=1 Tax=Ehrlichia sennetsu (strain ATCC VR-367 / Miyayama) TaxID=222891 RepID=Q2GCI0_EHRS3|nr:hypothetical protein NSE_0952 [Neorickettsia sennetsu str. Miyayama]